MWSQAVPSGCYVKKKFCDGGHLGYPIDEKHIFFSTALHGILLPCQARIYQQYLCKLLVITTKQVIITALQVTITTLSSQ
jgi:hypothetical protein